MWCACDEPKKSSQTLCEDSVHAQARNLKKYKIEKIKGHGVFADPYCLTFERLTRKLVIRIKRDLRSSRYIFALRLFLLDGTWKSCWDPFLWFLKAMNLFIKSMWVQKYVQKTKPYIWQRSWILGEEFGGRNFEEFWGKNFGDLGGDLLV